MRLNRTVNRIARKKTYRKLCTRSRQTIAGLVAKRARITLMTICRLLLMKLGVSVVTSTISRYLEATGWKKMKARKIPLLTQTQIIARIAWCRSVQDIDWNNVVFSDESMFQRYPNSEWLWMKGNKRIEIGQPKFNPKCHVWGWFSACGRSPLQFLDHNVNQWTYMDTMDAHIPHMELCHPDGFIYQQDNAPAHTAFLTMCHLNRKLGPGNVMKWPANSPDLNPIENLWGIIKRKLQSTEFDNVAEWRQAINEEWERISDQTLESLINSMKNRVQQCLDRGGKRVDY